MSTWSHRRQLAYLLIPLSLALAAFAFIYAKYIYNSPTCFDGVKNGTETGVDCGGTCSLVCSGVSLEPVVLWAKSFNVTGSVWNAVAYVQNPNLKSSAKNVIYNFDLYDQNNTIITSRQGVIDIPKAKTFAVFEGGINTQGKVIKRTEFSFGGDSQASITWMTDTSIEPKLIITNNPIETASTTPKITGTITNPNVQTSSKVELVALIFDALQNALQVSRTIIDPLSQNQSAPFTFTWPQPFPLSVDVCQTPSDVMLVLDRSGSMGSISKNPPQPLTDVKNTARDFLSNLHQGDQAGVVSFATSATYPIDQTLAPDFNLAESAIDSISISTSTKDQNTNIGDGLARAEEVFASNTDMAAKKVIVLLTDGVPTDPVDPSRGINFPTLYAEQIAQDIRAKNIDIYTIGLGKEVNTDILQNIAGSSSHFFSAPTTATLSSIYKNIGTSICTRKPNTIEILSRVL